MADYGLRAEVPLQLRKELQDVEREIKDLEKRISETRQSSFHNMIGRRAARPPAKALGPTVINLVFIVAKLADLPIVRETCICYGDTSEKWAPFNPFNADPIDSICSEVLFSEGLAPIIVDTEDNLYEDFDELVLEADLCNEILICIVDPWCLFSERDRKLLAGLDRVKFKNSGVIIPWNWDDEDYRRLKKDLTLGLIESSITRWMNQIDHSGFAIKLSPPKIFKRR